MTKQEYATKIAEKVNGKVQEFTKNGVKMTSVMVPIKDREHAGAMYYIDEDYERDTDVDDVVERIKNSIESTEVHVPTSEFIEDLQDYEKVKGHLMLRLYNKTVKDGYEVYRDTIDYGFEDFIIVPALDFDDYAIVITKAMIKTWEVPEDKVFEDSIENCREDVFYLDILERAKDDGQIDEGDMFAISNESKLYGAVSLLFAEEFLKEKFPNGYLLIPNSVNEVVVTDIPDDEFKALWDISLEMMNMHSRREYWLSDKTYVIKF